MPSQIIYPGTFDPITNGHLDIIDRALRLFDKVIVGVALNAEKGVAFNFDERFSLVQNVLKKYSHVEIHQFSGLLINFAREQETFTILRGLRAISDFEYELMLADLNRRLEPRLETIFFTPTEHYAYLSSSMIREIASLGGDVSVFVPQEVQEALKNKFKSTKPATQ